MKKIFNYYKKIIRSDNKIYIFLILVFIFGLLIGSLFINYINLEDKKLLTSQVTTYFNSIKKLSNDVYGINAFYDTLLNNTLVIFIIFILGISMIGIIIVIFILLFKGFTLGATISSIILKYKYKGILMALFYIFPIGILNILIIIFFSFFAINSSIKFINAIVKKDNLNFKSFLGKYIVSFIITFIITIILSFLDSYLTPIILKLITTFFNK